MKDSLLATLQFLLKENKSFVSYRKPNTDVVLSIIPKTNQLQYVSNFTDKGFVFAPFDTQKKSLFFALEHAERTRHTYNSSYKHCTNDFSTSIIDKNNHIQLIKKGVDFIQNNQTSKIVLSRKETIIYKDLDVIRIFENLLNKYKAAFVYIWYHPNIGLWLGATPETLIHLKNNSFKTMSLAGTQEYKGKLEVDWGKKEIQEHQFVTDYIKEELSKLQLNCSISKTNTIKAGSLLHIHAAITGRLQKKSQIESLIKALHPTPAVCGYPKGTAKDFILKNENYDREFYTGFLGELNFDSDKRQKTNNKRNIENHAYQYKEIQTSLYVNLRCMQVIEDTINIYLGGGITKDSNPESEYNETVAKAKIMKSVIA